MILSNSHTVLSISLPVLTGIKKIDTLEYGPPTWLWVPALLLYLASFAYLAVRLVVLAVRRRTVSADPALRRQRDGALLILLVAGLVFLSYAMSSYVTEQPRYPHHIVALYIPLALALGYSLSRGADLLAARAPWRRASPAIVLVLVLLLTPVLAVNLISVGQIENQEECFFYNQHDFSDLIQWLEERGIADVYTGYMYCYKLVFEAGEKIVATPNAGPVKYDRYPPYTWKVDAAAEVAVVFNPAYTSSIEAMQAGLQAGGIDYRRDDFSHYVIFWDFSERPDIYQLGLPN